MSAQHTPGAMIAVGHWVENYLDGKPDLVTSDGISLTALEVVVGMSSNVGEKIAALEASEARLEEQREKLLQLLEHAKHLINISTGKKSKLRAMAVIDEAIAEATKGAA